MHIYCIFVYFVYCVFAFFHASATKGEHLGPKILDAKIVHTSGKMFDVGGGSNNFDFWGSKDIFKVCSNIQKNTQNPNPIFKITICCIK